MELNFCFWLGCFLLSLSAFKICQHFFRKKAVLKAPGGFIPLKDALRQLPDRLKSYEDFNWKSAGMSPEDYYTGQMLYAFSHDLLPVYGELIFFGKSRRMSTRIPVNQLPPYERHTWGAAYDMIDDASKKPLYINLSVKSEDFDRWIKAEQVHPT